MWITKKFQEQRNQSSLIYKFNYLVPRIDTDSGDFFAEAAITVVRLSPADSCVSLTPTHHRRSRSCSVLSS